MLQRLGISLIDDLVFGEIEGAILILGDEGTGKSILCKQFAYQELIRGEDCIYVAIDETPDEIIESMKKFNWNLEAHEGETL